jgi:hypothetical protein
MAAPTYATDLVDITTAETTTNFTAIGAGGAITAETDFFIQGAACISKATAATWDTGGTTRGGVIFNNAAGVTIPTDGAVMTWVYWWGPNVLSSKATGGAEIIIGSSTTAYNAWYVSGADDWEFGGWRNYPVSNTVAVSRTAGSPTATLQYFGWNANVGVATNIGKGNPYGIDTIRYGRCTLTATNGDGTNGYASFGGSSPDAGAAAYDNAVTRRWGLLTPRDGAYFMQGLFRMGSSTTAVDFRDSNRIIFIQNTEKVTSNFNTIEILNTGSNISLTSCNFQALGTVSRGRWLTTDNAVVTLTGCSFTDLNTFTFGSNTSITGCTFRRCGLLTQSSATMSSCVITKSTSTTSLLVNNPSNISDITFESDGGNHAIEITSAGTYSFTDLTFTGYASTDGTTGNEVFYNNSGGAVTINASGITGILSVRNSAGSSTTVNNTVSITVTGLKDNTEVRVYSSEDNTPPYAVPTELAGTDSATSGTTDNRSFTFGATPGNTIYIRVFNTNWIADDLTYVVPGSSTEIQIPQRRDRVYSNP